AGSAEYESTNPPAGGRNATEGVPYSAETRLFAPQALVCTFDAECGNPYGCALLARAYPAWYEKWMPGGAKKTLRLRMIKDAYIGERRYYLHPRTAPPRIGEMKMTLAYSYVRFSTPEQKLGNSFQRQQEKFR